MLDALPLRIKWRARVNVSPGRQSSLAVLAYAATSADHRLDRSRGKSPRNPVRAGDCFGASVIILFILKITLLIVFIEYAVSRMVIRLKDDRWEDGAGLRPQRFGFSRPGDICVNAGFMPQSAWSHPVKASQAGSHKFAWDRLSIGSGTGQSWSGRQIKPVEHPIRSNKSHGNA
jgi:hypothetical protein